MIATTVMIGMVQPVVRRVSSIASSTATVLNTQSADAEGLAALVQRLLEQDQVDRRGQREQAEHAGRARARPRRVRGRRARQAGYMSAPMKARPPKWSAETQSSGRVAIVLK